MTFSFQCPSCHATVTGSEWLAGGPVRCPQCDRLVQAREPTSGTPQLASAQGDRDRTLLLEAVESSGATNSPQGVSPELIEVEPPPAGPPAEPPLATAGPPPAQRDDDERPVLRVNPRRRLEETDTDMTPMVDVTFLLLIFFMVTAAFTLQKSIEVPKPSEEDPSTEVVEQEPEDLADFVTVQVDRYNTYHVITVDWEEEAPSLQDLHIMLRRARHQASTAAIPTKLRVEAHGESLHENVVAALDAGPANGFDEVQLTTLENE